MIGWPKKNLLASVGILIFGLLIFMAACTNSTQAPTSVAIVNTPSATATPTLTAVPSHTPTPTPTPTATAVLLTVVGDPRSLQRQEPQPNGRGANGRLNIYALDPAQQSLTRLFEGGSRTPISSEMWLTAVANNQLLINVGGGPLALFDTAVAWEASDQ